MDGSPPRRRKRSNPTRIHVAAADPDEAGEAKEAPEATPGKARRLTSNALKLLRDLQGMDATVIRKAREMVGTAGSAASSAVRGLAYKPAKSPLLLLRARPAQSRYQTEAAERRNQMVGAFIGIVSEVQEQLREQMAASHQRFVVRPGSLFRRRWDVLTLVLLLYTAIFTPVQIAFLSDEWTTDNIPDWWPVFVADRVIDLVFTLDLLVNFRSAWVTSDGGVAFNQRAAARRYLRSWFLVDLLSVLPYDLISLTPDVDNAAALRLPKLLRLFRLMKIARVMRAMRIFKRWEQNITMRYGWVRIISFSAVIALLSHWMGCFLFLVSTFSEGTSWVTDQGMEDAGAASQYVVSLYWAVMTLTTIGYGDVTATNDAERVYFVAAMLLGAGFYAYIVGTMCSLVQGLDKTTLEFQAQMDTVNEFLSLHNVPRPLCLKIRKYLFYQRDSSQSRSEGEILAILSPGIRTELALFKYERILHSVPQFADAPRRFLAETALCLVAAVFSPNELIVVEGHLSDKMYILNRGRLQKEKLCFDGQITVSDALRPGACFGQEALLFGAAAKHTVRCLTYAETVYVSKQDIDRVMEQHPEVEQLVRRGMVRELWRRVMGNVLRQHRTGGSPAEVGPASPSPSSPGPSVSAAPSLAASPVRPPDFADSASDASSVASAAPGGGGGGDDVRSRLDRTERLLEQQTAAVEQLAHAMDEQARGMARLQEQMGEMMSLLAGRGGEPPHGLA